MNYYDLLQIHPNADEEVIEAAYKALAKKYHPDTYIGEKTYALKKMQEINQAHDVLKDKTKKSIYDHELNFVESATTSNQSESYHTPGSDYWKMQKEEAEAQKAEELRKHSEQKEADYIRMYNDKAEKEEEENRIKEAKRINQSFNHISTIGFLIGSFLLGFFVLVGLLISNLG